MDIIKLGGSVITDKSKEDSFKTDLVDKLSSVLSKHDGELVIVHGAGSYGHILAEKYDLNNGFKKSGQLKGVSQTQLSVQQLNTMVLDLLNKNDVCAVSISPHSILKLKSHKPLKFDCKIFKDFLDQGFAPVTFGDVVLDSDIGFSICSGDLLMLLLADFFKPDRIIFLFDEDGLYSSNPKQNKNAEFLEKTTINELEKLSTKSDSHADVTGGMKGKIETIKKIAKIGIDVYLVNGNKPDRLYKILNGKKTRCTIVKGE